jgi:hypothetical protein
MTRREEREKNYTDLRPCLCSLQEADSIPPRPPHPPIPTQHIQHLRTTRPHPIHPTNHIANFHPAQAVHIMQIQHRSDQPRTRHSRRRVLEGKRGRGSHIHRRTTDHIWWEGETRRRETLPLSGGLSVHRGQSAWRVRRERISGQRGRRVLEEPEEVSLGEIAQAECVAGGGRRAGGGDGHCAA